MARVIVLLAALFAWVQTVAYAQAPPVWPDSFVSRLEALALMQSLNAEILGSRSATTTLEKWCGDHKLAADPKIAAHVIKGVDKAPTGEQRQRLQATGGEEMKYRHVRLVCGNQVLSEADNWYLPTRLTAEMNRLLETTDTPFGTAVQPLEPYRQTIAVKLLWSPLPDGWERQSAAMQPAATTDALAIPDALFEHHAVLYTREHRPFAEVVEVYQRQILAFAPVR
jgi:chorismate-pyruvate lyase